MTVPSVRAVLFVAHGYAHQRHCVNMSAKVTLDKFRERNDQTERGLSVPNSQQVASKISPRHGLILCQQGQFR